MKDAYVQLVILACEDVARSKAFYDTAFGWEVKVDLPVYVEYGVPGGSGLSLYDRSSFGANTNQVPERCPPGKLVSAELYLHVRDLDEAMRRLEEAGARQLSPPAVRPWEDTAAYYADPDGHVIGVATHPVE